MCATSHSVVFRGVKRAFGYPEWKLTGSLSPSLIVEAFSMPEAISLSKGVTLPRLSYASVLLESLKHFLQSGDAEPHTWHIPRHGAFASLSEVDFKHFAEQAIARVTAMWEAMRQKTGGLPLGHDGYLKLWALSKPQARTDYVMVDEAQDLNPVLLGVLEGLECPIVYVGDPYQQIYEWRGAVNAMEKVASRNSVLLSQSFRFGAEIAEAATIVLRKLGARDPLRGLPSTTSHLGRVRPDVILARTNAGVIENVFAVSSAETSAALCWRNPGAEASAGRCPAYQARRRGLGATMELRSAGSIITFRSGAALVPETSWRVKL